MKRLLTFTLKGRKMEKKGAAPSDVKVEFPLSAVIDMYSFFEEIKEKWAGDPELHESINNFELEIKKDDFHYRMGQISMKDLLRDYKMDDLYHQAKAELSLNDAFRLFTSFLELEQRLPAKVTKDIDYQNKRACFMMALEENKLRAREWKEMRPFPLVRLSFDIEGDTQADVIPIRPPNQNHNTKTKRK
ncbi:MAG: hypothetical protein HY282_09945 [Nitrospirae bacterium]|nr:hypothetical protein [Candidatus Manganitrophaceae bacterium]